MQCFSRVFPTGNKKIRDRSLGINTILATQYIYLMQKVLCLETFKNFFAFWENLLSLVISAAGFHIEYLLPFSYKTLWRGNRKIWWKLFHNHLLCLQYYLFCLFISSEEKITHMIYVNKIVQQSLYNGNYCIFMSSFIPCGLHGHLYCVVFFQLNFKII